MTHRTGSMLALLAAALTAGTTASAQVALPDVRWQTWVGCWTPAAGEQATLATPGAAADAPLLCLLPTTDASVELLTVADGKVIMRDTVDASGARRGVEREGCRGWERAEFAGGARRVHYQSEYDCDGGVRRTTSGVLAFAPSGEMLDVQSVSSGGGKTVRVARYRDAGIPASLPTEIASALGGRALAVSAARTAAAGPLTEQEIIEAARTLDPLAMQAWLIERGTGFSLDAKTLLRLADAGVPGSITDIMIALSNPRVFAVNRSPLGADVAALPGAVPARDGYTGRRVYVGVYDSPFGYGPSPYYFLFAGYPYYYGSSSGYYGSRYGQYWYHPPTIIVQNPARQSNGRAVKGRGYTRDRSETTSDGAPRVERAPRSSPGSSGSGNATSSGGSTTSSGGSTTSTESGRKAKPRP